MTVLASLMIAVLLVFILLPQFNEITGKSISLSFDPITVASLFFGAILTGVVSGYYPAFYLSRITTIEILKGKAKTSFSELVARKGLVVFQFVVSLFLIVSVLAVYNQVSFIQNMNLGYDRDNVVYLEMGEKPEVFIAKAKELPGVINASSINGAIAQSGDNANTSGLSWEGYDPEKAIVYSIKTVDYDLIETLGIEMAAGRSFSRDFGAEGEKLIFNETAIKTMGIENPIGKKINMWGEEKTIVGVTKDFFANSVHEEIPPIVMRFEPSRTSEFVVKIATGKEKKTVEQLGTLYAEFNPGFPFNYTFMDEKYNQLYTSEQRVATLSKYFAGLAILISCLGLFGLAMFNAKQRAKEIGIRKVLGASVGKVVIMLSKDFVKLAIIAVFIAFPISWYALTQWLDNYAYKADLSILTFVLSFAGIIVITLFTVSYQAIKAALVNPVESLKSE
jgi:ABC-type antimicrobial peptide transport system permease subunit